MLYRIWNLVIKEVIHLWRDKILLIFIILGPVSELVAVAWATSGEIEHIPMAVVDYDHSAASRGLVQALVNTRTFDDAFYPTSEEEAQKLVESGTALVLLLIPEGFTARLTDPTTGPPQVQLILDGSDPSVARTARSGAEGAIASYAQQVAQSHPGGPLADWGQVIDLRVRVWFNEELKMSNYEVPSELGFMLIAVALMISSLGIARERELGTLEQLMVTPLRNAELVIGKAVPAMIIAYLDFLLMLSLVVWVFQVPMRGSLLLLLGVAFFYLFIEIGWGLMISAFASTQWQALVSIFALMMVEMIFSGYAFPVENMPTLLRYLANFVPIKHWLIILRSILLKGAGVRVFWRELLALAGLGVVINTLTLTVLRRKLE